MKAMICRRWGGPEDLKLEDVEPAVLGPGQVRIRIRAGGVSFATTLVVAGKYRVTTQKGFDDMLRVADHLVARERAGKR